MEPKAYKVTADFTGLVFAREEFQKFKNEKVSTDAEFPHLHLHRPKICVSGYCPSGMQGLGVFIILGIYNFAFMAETCIRSVNTITIHTTRHFDAFITSVTRPSFETLA